MTEKSSTSRRGLMLGTLALGAVALGWQRYGWRLRRVDFQPIDGLPGWRRVTFDGISRSTGTATSAVFLGIGGDEAPAPLPVGELCTLLLKDLPGDSVPVAVFSDVFCPYCRRLASRLNARAADPASGIRLTWHELPLLGRSSVIAARAAVAADLQGRYVDYQTHLMSQPFRPTSYFLAELAAALELDVGRFLRDMEGEEVARRIHLSRRAAETLGIWGTPGLVIGRTLAMGGIRARELDYLIGLERGDAANAGLCAPA